MNRLLKLYIKLRRILLVPTLWFFNMGFYIYATIKMIFTEHVIIKIILLAIYGGLVALAIFVRPVFFALLGAYAIGCLVMVIVDTVRKPIRPATPLIQPTAPPKTTEPTPISDLSLDELLMRANQANMRKSGL